jgi:hypothetical protein
LNLGRRGPPPFHAIITIAEGWERSPATLACLETLGNLMARFCPEVTIVVSEAQSALVGDTETLATMIGADPYGKFSIAGNSFSHDLEIRIGGGTPKDQRQIAVSFNGWTARISGFPTAALACPPPAVNHAPGAELAACLAGAAAFRYGIERTTAGMEPFGLDIFNFGSGVDIGGSEAPAQFDLLPLKILMVGAGSVGSASGYFLPRLGFKGQIDVLDHDRVEIENLDRSPVFEASHDDQLKAEVVVAHLNARNVQATAFTKTWSEFVQENPSLMRKHDVWLALANEHGVRRSMQMNFPPVTLQASTGRNWGVQFGRHIPFVDDCQLDRFPVEPAGPLNCADGPVRIGSGKQVDAALPFSSFTAGLLVAAGVVRMGIGALGRGPNMGLLSFEPKFDLLTMNRHPSEACICSKASRPIWDKMWGL